MITGFATDQPFDHLKLYGDFLERETDSTGTVVLHHGRVKRPGKQVPDFVDVELKALTKDTDERLAGIAREAEQRFGLNQVLVVHRLGTIHASDSVLLAIVSGKTRDRCFAACSWIVDEVKKEEFIELIENP
ncbi:MAG TPA: molybdopterin biosynthesis protein MoeE [Treponema sp.]|nr:MAG: molybdopterin biosynthesis protein MoeE [Treponema sp. GWA1_62_8]OHE68992.1 MAG: molybdopterin biosynthesis protein MoeE [Treponema sp. GWC1_61_84]OHE69953.1 MAG: molybdopterin biosynthesis protein MoeE [Treponema sp. RIFOXYC1_FULL_61_9]HCM28517.1 molybdopterin biosynthesis protein MoeE [Treponema sp.]